MPHPAGKIIGFIFGIVTFLVLFKYAVLHRISPSDELAPGIVVTAAVANGFLFAFLGSLLQKQLSGRK